MGDTARRAASPRRILAACMAALCALESGVLPAVAADAAADSQTPSAAPATSGFDVLSKAAAGAGWAPASTLGAAAIPAPATQSGRVPGTDSSSLPRLLDSGATAGRLRAAGSSLISGALSARRSAVTRWVERGLNAPLAGLSDSAAVPAPIVAQIKANLPALLIAEAPILPPSASAATVRAAQDDALRRIANLGLPDFAARAYEPPPNLAPAPAVPSGSSAGLRQDFREKLGQKEELAGAASPDLADLDRLAGKVDGELGPRSAGQAGDSGDVSDANWASLEALRRLFNAAGSAPDAQAPVVNPVAPEQSQAIESQVAKIEALKAQLQADIAQRDAAQAMLGVANKAREIALEDRRSGKDELEFRKNFARLSMVMDLSYSLNLLNSADAALANMQALVAKKIESINQQQQANTGAGAAAGNQAGNTQQWIQQAQQAAAADQQQASGYAALSKDVTGIANSVTRFGTDVPALLAMIDSRDKGQSAGAVAEYNRRLALLPSIQQQLKTGSSNASSGVSSLSLSYLQSKAAEVSGDVALLAGADAKISAVPVEFAGALVVAVPGVPTESVANPSQAQMLALLSRRQAFWQSQYNEEASMLASIQQAMDPSNSAMTTDSFGAPQPVSLAAWRTKELALDDQIAGAETAMLAQADADEAVIEGAGGGASLPRLSNMPPEELRVALPKLLDRLSSLSIPDTDAGFAAKAAYIDLARLVCYLGDATARRLEARATAAALDQPVNVILPKARDAFKKAVKAWQTVLDDVALDVAYVNAGAPASQGAALIARKKALVDGVISPALLALQDLLVNTLIPYQNTRIAQSDPSNSGDGYQTLYTQKISLYKQISDGLNQTLPWALASDGAAPFNVSSARGNIANLRKTYDSNLATVLSNQQTVAQATDPSGTATEVVYGESMPVSLVRRIAVYRAEKDSRAASMNSTAAQINAILAQMDALGKTNLAATWRLPTNLDGSSPSAANQLNAMVSGNYLQNMAAAIQAVASAAEAAGGSPSIGVGSGGGNLPVGNQPPITISNNQKIALLGLEAVTRLVPSSQSGPAGNSYAYCLARYLFSDALVSSSQTYLTQRIPLFKDYLAKAKSALDAAEADLDVDLAWVSGDRSNGPAVLNRKIAVFTSLASILNQGVALFNQKAAWDGEGVASAASATTYYNGLSSTYASGNQATSAELQAAQQFQSALAESRAKIDSQRAEVVGWLNQLNSPNESALARVSSNISAIQDKTRTVLETNVQARAAQAAADKATASVEKTLAALSAERSALDRDLNGVGDLARLGPALSARTRDAVGQNGAWIAEGTSGPQTLVIPKSQLGTFLSTLFSGLSSGAAASNVASLSADILKDPTALARLIPGSKVIPVGQGPDGFYLVYQTEFSTPGGLETANQATLGNIAKIWGQNVSLTGYRFESPPSAGNAPFGDQGVTVQVESLDSDHAVNYLDVTFHKFLQDIPDAAGGVVSQAQQTRMMIFDDFALLLDDGKVYFGAAGFGDVAATNAANQPYYYGGNVKTSVKFTKVLSLNASQQELFAKDPRKFLQTVNLDFTGYDPSLNQNYVVSGSGQDMNYSRSQIGVGVDLKEALKQSDTFMLNLYYAHTSGNEDPTQSSVGASILKGFTFDFMGQKANLNVSAGGELGQVQNSGNARVSFELPQQGIAISAQGKIMGTGEAYYAEIRKKLGDHTSAALSYGSQYIGLNNRLTVSFSSSYTLAELWRAVTGQAASDLTGGRALAEFDKALADFFTRSQSDAAAAELKRVFDADVGRQMTALAIGKLTREIETLTRAGALLDNTRQSAMVGFVSNAIGPGTAEAATGGGFQVGTRTDMTLTKTQRALIESETATLFSLGLELEERLLDLTKAWQEALADMAQARWRELLSAWLAAHADDAALKAEAESDAAAAADARRQAELRYASLTGRGPNEVPPFAGVNPQDFDAMLTAVAGSLRGSDRIGALIQRARADIDAPKAGFNVMDWVPWVEKLTFTVGAQLPDTLSSQPLSVGVTITLPVYDPTRGHNDAAMKLQRTATLLEMRARLRQTVLRAHGERLAAAVWAERARGAAATQDRFAADLSDGIRQFRNALIQPSELRDRARRWRDAVSETLSARTRASLEAAWAELDAAQDVAGEYDGTSATPADMNGAFDQATQSAPNWEALARRSQAARELLEASDRTVRKVDLDLTIGSNLTVTGLALLPAFGITGLGAMPIVGVQLAPEELRQLDVARTGAEAGLYSRLRDKAAADVDLGLTQATIDAEYLDRQIAVYRDQLLPQLQAAQDGSAAKARELTQAQAAYADLLARRKQTTAAMNQMLGRPLDSPLKFSPDPAMALAAFSGRAAALDPVAAARDALASRVKVAQAVEAAVDKNLKVDQLRLEPISLIATSLGRLVNALSGDGVASPEMMAMAREQTLEAQRALEAFDAQLPAVRARLAAQLSAVLAARQALSGKTDPASRLQDLELARRGDLLTAQLQAWGGAAQDAADGSLPSSYAELEDRLRRAEQTATLPTAGAGDTPAVQEPGPMAAEGSLRWYDAIQTLGGDPINRRFVEGWVEARLRSPLTSPEAVAMLARLREESADERRRLDMAGADARAELLLSRLRLGAGLMRWSEGMGLGDTTRARVGADLGEAAALLHLPPSVRPESLLSLMPAEGDGDLASVAAKYLKDAESLDMEAIGRTLFLQGLPAEFQDQAGTDQYPELAADMVAQRMSSRGFTPIAAIGMFKGQWVSGGFLEAPHPEDIQNTLIDVLDDALRRELEQKDRLKTLGLLLHSLMASVADKVRVVSSARLRETFARRQLAGTLERVRMNMAPLTEATAAAAEAQAAQEAFVTALYALREDFARLTTELTALGVNPATYSSGARFDTGPKDQPFERTPREKLLAYWADRMQDPDFERRVEDLLSGQPDSVIARLRELSARYRTAARDADAVRDNDFTPAERLDLLTRTDVQGRRRALEEVLRGVLNGAQGADAAHSPAWSGLMEFLRADVTSRAQAQEQDLKTGDQLRGALRDAFLDPSKAPPQVRAEIQKLEKLQDDVDLARRQALAGWLARTNTVQDHVLKDRELDAYVSALDAFDAEMQKALESKGVAGDAGWTRMLDAMFGVRESLDRRRDRLKYGRGLLTVDAAITLDEARLHALRYAPDETREIDPASESLAFLRGLRQKWTGRPDAIPALVALRGSDGKLEWATVEDLAKAKAVGRLATIDGRSYMAPPDAVGSAPTTAADAVARQWREVIEGEDAARERLKQARDARDAAAREAGLLKTLETVEIAVVGGGPLGTGAATGTMTLSHLRELEAAGLALWFHANADPGTGLRSAIPAVAARWIDPAELVLVLLPAAPLSGRYPTLEALLSSKDAAGCSRGLIGAAGLRALEAEAAAASLAARREGWLKLKLNAWGFALSSGTVQAVYLNEDELRKAAANAADPKDPGHGWTFLRADALSLGLADDGTLVSVKVGDLTIPLGTGVPSRWISQAPLAMETDARGRVTRLFLDEKSLNKEAAGWSLEDASGRVWKGGQDVPALLRARSWTDTSTGLTVSLGRDLLLRRREAAKDGAAGAAHWSYAPGQWPALITEIPRGIVSTPLEIVTGRDPNQQGYLGRANARRGEGGATIARGALGSVLTSIDLFGLINDPVDRYFDPSQYPDSVRRSSPLLPDGSTDGGKMISSDGKKKVFYGVGSFQREERWAIQDQEASRNEILAAFHGGVRRETALTVRGRAGDYLDSTVGLTVGRGAALAAIDQLGARLDAGGGARLSDSPAQAAVDRVDAVVQVVAGADTQDSRLQVYRAALERLKSAPPPAVTDSEVDAADKALQAALAARRGVSEAVAAASPTPNFPGYPVMPSLFAALSR